MLLIAGGAAAAAVTMLNRSSGTPGSQREAAVSHRTDPPAAEPSEQPAAEAPAAAQAEEPAGDAPAEKGSKSSSRHHRDTAPASPDKDKDKEKKSASALYEEGADLFVQGKASAAKDRFKEAIAADSRYAPAYRGLGLAYSAEGKRDKAKKSFERYLQLRPGASDADAIRKRIEQLEQ
jgi:tetratricopeptide (TPR) repeat protein